MRLLMIMVAVCLFLPGAPAVAGEYETGPVTRKWGLGWDDGPTGRLWLNGVWELSLAGGPDDYRRDREDYYYTTGYPPVYQEQERAESRGDRDEQGFVRAQVGRLLARRGPAAAVAYLGVGYSWLNSQDYYDDDPVIMPSGDSRKIDYAWDIWSLSLGVRPSFMVMDFLSVEFDFGVVYRWEDREWTEYREYYDSFERSYNHYAEDSTRFDYFGWTGMGSLSFIIWFR